MSGAEQAWPRPTAPDGIPLVAEDDDLVTAETERRFAASQWRLMARRFVRNRAALIGGSIVLLFYLMALFAPFLAPYTLERRFDDLLFLEPRRIHFFHDGQFQPHVYGVESGIDPETLNFVHTT